MYITSALHTEYSEATYKFYIQDIYSSLNLLLYMLRSIQRIRPRAIVTDWDETITISDTIPLVAQTAYNSKPQFSPPFDHFTKKYMDAYSEYSRQFKEANGERTITNERQFQHGMRLVELTSINEMVRLGLFSGVTRDDFKSQASKIHLRPGFTHFLTHCRELAIPVEILSINWTSVLIKECLRLHGFDDVKVVVNELEFENEICTGRWLLEPVVRTALDKLKYIESLGNDIMYVGDSGTDLLAILEAQWGVVMEGTTLIDGLDKLGVSHGKIGDDKEVSVGNWKDIHEYIGEI